MTSITLPKDLEDWARAEVAAGRAESVEALAALALDRARTETERHRRLVEAGRASGWVDEAGADARIDLWIAEDEANSAVPAK